MSIVLWVIGLGFFALAAFLLFVWQGVEAARGTR